MDLSGFHRLDIIVVCGLPGSGKSHFSQRFFKDSGRKRVNRKEIRRLLFEMTSFGGKWQEDFFNEEEEHLVGHVERRIIEHLLKSDHKLLIDNTNVSRSSRDQYLKMAQTAKKSIGVIFIDTPMKKCLERNRASTDPTPERVISNLSAAVDIPEKSEGYREAIIVKDY